MPAISRSTCWNSPRHTDGYEMIAEIAALGFGEVELSHGIRLSLVPGIIRALDEKLVRVTSTHNFCPLPPGVNSAAPNVFTPSSADERITLQWERYTRRSLEFARQVGARVVVAHLGDVEFGLFNPARAVDRVQRSRHPSKAAIDRLRDRAAACVAKTQKRKPPYWERVFAWVERVLPAAREAGVTIGAENREKCDELPLEADWPALLRRFGPESGLGYWHDTGHAHLKEKMRLTRHERLLEDHADRLAGFHIHDVRGLADHLPPGTGEVDFRMVARFVRPEHVVVLELNPRLSPQEVVDARSFLEDLMPATAPTAPAAGS
jgi:sugar phosphate isomerase/epimerase